jgi:hypothetical protein
VELAAIVVVIVVAVGFDYTNGFHDAANAIATSVSTRALTPRAALSAPPSGSRQCAGGWRATSSSPGS